VTIEGGVKRRILTVLRKGPSGLADAFWKGYEKDRKVGTEGS
jgi:hypothetical protein